MADIGEMAKKVLKERKLASDTPPPPNAKMKAQGKALKNAESTAPAYKNISKPIEKAAERNKKSMVSGIVSEDPFAKLNRDLPRGGKVMKVAASEGLDQVEKQVAKKGLGKLGRMGMAGLAGGAVGLGINALMEGLDAEEAGSEQEVLDAAEMRQAEKTNALVGGKKLPAMVEASTKKKVVAKPLGRSDEDIVKGFNGLLDDNFGPEDGEEGEEENDNEDSVMVTEREESEDGPVTARYRLKMNGKGGLSPDDKARAAALHSQLRKPGKSMSGEMDIPEYGEKVKIRRR